MTKEEVNKMANDTWSQLELFRWQIEEHKNSENGLHEPTAIRAMAKAVMKEKPSKEAISNVLNYLADKLEER